MHNKNNYQHFSGKTISVRQEISSPLSTINNTTGSFNKTDILMEISIGKSQEETSSGIISSTLIIFPTDIFATHQSPIKSRENSSQMQNDSNTPSSILFSTSTAIDFPSAPQSEKYPAFSGVTRWIISLYSGSTLEPNQFITTQREFIPKPLQHPIKSPASKQLQPQALQD